MGACSLKFQKLKLRNPLAITLRELSGSLHLAGVTALSGLFSASAESLGAEELTQVPEGSTLKWFEMRSGKLQSLSSLPEAWSIRSSGRRALRIEIM